MIEINLLPQDLKPTHKKPDVSPKQFLYLIPFVFGILICVHIFLAGVSLIKNFQLRALEDKWESLAPQKKISDDFKKGYDLLSADSDKIQQLANQRVCWSQKLNKLSLDLPSGLWFNELSLAHKDFILRGSAVSLQKAEMTLINKFIDNLKNDPEIYKDFKSLELSSVQRRFVGGYEIVDFVLSGALR